MLPTAGLPAIGRHNSSKAEKVSATAKRASLDNETPERLSTIKSWAEAGKEAVSRRKAKPTVLPAKSSITGFTFDAAPARVQFLSSSKSEGSESSKTERPSVAVQNSLDEKDIKLEELRHKLVVNGDHSKALHGQAVLGLLTEGSVKPEAEDVQSSNLSPSWVARPEARASEFSKLNEEELTRPHHVCPSALADCGINEIKAQLKSSNAEESSAQPLQLRHAASPYPDAAPSPIAAALTTDIDTQMHANTSRQAPFHVLDTLLNGGGPVTETCSRRKLKSPPPRTKRNCSRHSKQKLPELRQPLLSRPSPANTPDAAEASDGHTHSYLPVPDKASQLCCGVWQKLGSSLSAVWQWLCKSGIDLKKLGRKMRKKLITALGLGPNEAQALLAMQQAEEREALAVRPHLPLQPVDQPHSSSGSSDDGCSSACQTDLVTIKPL